MDAREVFIGRDDLIEALASSLSPNAVVVGDIFGVYGIGKSKLLDRLREKVPKRGVGPSIVLHADLATFDTDTSGTQALAGLTRAHKTFEQVLGKACDDLVATRHPLAKRLGGNFKVSLRRARNDQTRINIEIQQKLSYLGGTGNQRSEDGSLEAQNVQIEVAEAEAGIRRQIEASESVLETDFVDMINEISATSRVLWTIDGFEMVADQELGRWLLSLVRSLRNTLVVLARTPLDRDPELPGEVQRHALRRLTRAEVQSFLEACEEESDPALVTVVHEFTSGHPLSVAMVAELHQSLPPAQRPAPAFARVLESLPLDKAEAHAELAMKIVACAGVEGLDRVMEACAVARVFDVEMLGRLVADDSDVPPRRLVETLRRQTFIDELPGRETASYHVHAFIANSLRSRLLRDDPARFRELHRRAADYHYEWLRDYEEGVAKQSYAAWYRYDDPIWRARQLAWLYHEASVARALPEGPKRDAQKQVARLRFTRVFTDAFWWWGCYLDFPFCRELVDDWERTQDDRDHWIGELRALIATYPKGHRKVRPEAVWSAVEDSLLAIIEVCGLDARPSELQDDDARHTLALIENLLAHSEHHREAAGADARRRRYERALAHYDRADGLLVHDQDWWNDAWTLFERAELHHDFGHPSEARRDWDSAAALLLDGKKEIDDEELTANLHRLRADMLWAANQHADALEAYGRAVAHAYLFQNRPHEPDMYTAAFYREMTERAVGRLREAWQDGLGIDESAAALSKWLSDADPVDAEALRTALAGKEDDAVAELILPAAPGEADLLAKDSPYLRRWRRVYREAHDRLDGDLRTAVSAAQAAAD